ncbi:MAG TPA: hexose kinase [Candidatus Limiplasma sp.]|nr:hexose kinase [Candidatus Limiplasma sp.]
MISTLTINTAIDRLLFIESFCQNSTNRIKRVVDVLGGKGTHVSLNLSQLGMSSRCFGIAMGETGKRILHTLKAHENLDVRLLYVKKGESRTNYAIIEDDHTCTLVTEKGEVVSRELCEELLGKLEKELTAGDTLILSGDASNTEVPFFYNRVMERLEGRGIRFLLDTSSRNLVEGLKAKPYLVKPNVEELSQVLGCPIGSEAEILSGMRRIAAMGIEVVAVSCGGEGSYVLYQGQFYRVHPLTVQVLNTIGCGDAYLSGLAYGLEIKADFETTLRIATAVSAATAESDLTVGFDPARAAALQSQVVITKL